MPYFLANSAFWSFNFLLCFFSCGKSTKTQTMFALAKVLKSTLLKTSLSSFMHQPHQSEPLKSSSMYRLDLLAFVDAFAKSVSHPAAPAFTPNVTVIMIASPASTLLLIVSPFVLLLRLSPLSILFALCHFLRRTSILVVTGLSATGTWCFVLHS